MIARRVGRVTSVAAGAVAAAIVLSGCAADMRPGAAAVVDDTVISMSQADDAASVYCQVAVYSASQQGGQTLAAADVRRQAVSELITAVVADELAAGEDLSLAASSWQFDAEQTQQILSVLPDVDPDLAVSVLEEGQRTYAIAERLGERATGEASTPENAQEIQAAGREQIAAAVAEADISVDPRFGLGSDGAQIAETGSLSVAGQVSDDAGSDVVPATQQCT